MRAVVIAAWLAVACDRDDPEHERPPENEQWLSPREMEHAGIRVTEAVERDLPQAIAGAGLVAFHDLRVTHVLSPVTGRVTRVHVKPGDRVSRGAPLVTMVSADVGTALSELIQARADLHASEADLARESTLLAQDATSARAKEAAEDAHRTAVAEHERAKLRASLLRSGSLDTVTQEYTVTSHLDGEVIARTVDPGAEVVGQYSGGAAPELFMIGDVEDVRVEIDVRDVDLPHIELGAAVALAVVAFPGCVFRGQIDYVASTVDPVLRTGRVRCSIPNPTGALKPGMFASVSILQPSHRELAVPKDAVVRINESNFVYVVRSVRPDGRLVFERRPVTSGAGDGGFIAIVEGLKPGDRVMEGSTSHDHPTGEVRLTPRQLEEGRITTAVVAWRDVVDVVRIGGRISFADDRISHVVSQVNGRITKVLAQLGQRVVQGAPLAAITSPDVGKNLADVVKAKAALIQATHERRRQQELFDAHVSAKRALEAAQAAQRKARATLERAQRPAQLLVPRASDRVSQDYLLRSPIAGEVIDRTARPALEVQGQYSNEGSSTNLLPLFTIGERGWLWFLGDVYELDLPHLREGDAVSLRVEAYPDRRFHSRIEWISEVIDPASRTAKIRCLVDDPEHLLRPEMYESVEISLPARQMLVVPRDAVLWVAGETIVFVATQRRAPDGAVVFERRTIVAELDGNPGMVPVVSGLTAGETVAVNHAVMLVELLER